MKKLTADICRAKIEESHALKERGYLSISGEFTLQALEIALPVLVKKTHISVIAAELEAVRDSIELNPHQNAVISCAIDRLNELNVQVVELSRSLFEQQQTQPSTNPQIDNDGWIEWGGGECAPVIGMVKVEWSDGSVDTGMADNWRWAHDRKCFNIIAYRVIENDGREG